MHRRGREPRLRCVQFCPQRTRGYLGSSHGAAVTSGGDFSFPEAAVCYDPTVCCRGSPEPPTVVQSWQTAGTGASSLSPVVGANKEETSGAVACLQQTESPSPEQFLGRGGASLRRSRLRFLLPELIGQMQKLMLPCGRRWTKHLGHRSEGNWAKAISRIPRHSLWQKPWSGAILLLGGAWRPGPRDPVSHFPDYLN